MDYRTVQQSEGAVSEGSTGLITGGWWSSATGACEGTSASQNRKCEYYIFYPLFKLFSMPGAYIY